MSSRKHVRTSAFASILAASLFIAPSAQAWPTALGTAITYQGHLKQGGQSLNGTADLVFTLYDAETGGNQSSSQILLVDVPVVDGVFTVDLDFGPNAFASGDARWVAIGVASPSNNGNGPFAGLTPRQRFAATPYALFAKRTDLTLYSDAAVFSNPANNFTGGFSGVFAGQGSALTNLNPTALVAGTANIDISGVAAFANIANSANAVTGIVPVTNGGTGGNDASSARLNIQAAQRGANGDITSLSALSTPISLAQGGHGATEASGARAALGAAKSGINNDITALNALTAPLTIAQGGTNAGTAAGARSALGVPGLVDPNNFSRAQEINLLSDEVGLSVRAAPGQTLPIQQWRNSAGTVVAAVDATGMFTGNGGGLNNLSASVLSSGIVPSARLLGTYSNQLLLTNPNNFISGIAQGITNLDAGSLASGNMPMARMPGNGTWNTSGMTINGGSSVININANEINLNGQVNFDETPTLPTTTRTMAIAQSAFTPATDAIAFSNAGTGLTGSTAGQVVTFVAPLNLPNGATITEIRGYVFDNDATQNITVAQLARGLTSTTPVVSGTQASSGASATVQQVVVPSFPGPLDNDLTTFWLSATWTVPALPTNIRLLGVRVTYTVDAPLP